MVASGGQGATEIQDQQDEAGVLAASREPALDQRGQPATNLLHSGVNGHTAEGQEHGIT